MCEVRGVVYRQKKKPFLAVHNTLWNISRWWSEHYLIKLEWQHYLTELANHKLKKRQLRSHSWGSSWSNQNLFSFFFTYSANILLCALYKAWLNRTLFVVRLADQFKLGVEQIDCDTFRNKISLRMKEEKEYFFLLIPKGIFSHVCYETLRK